MAVVAVTDHVFPDLDQEREILTRAGHELRFERNAVSVEEVTVAGNLLEMFAAIEGIGDDLVLRDRTASPTLLVGRMVLAGI